MDRIYRSRQYDDSLWRSGKGGVGSLSFESEELGFDLDEDLLGKVTSLYVRVPFEAGDDFFLQERLSVGIFWRRIYSLPQRSRDR